MQRGHETEHHSAVGVPTDRLTEAPGGSPASALQARTGAQLRLRTAKGAEGPIARGRFYANESEAV